MQKDFATKLVLILAFGALCAYIGWPAKDKWGFRSGQLLEGRGIVPAIDIQGGASLTYRVLFEAEKTAVVGSKRDHTETIVNTLKKRLDLRGLKEPDIRSFGDDRITMMLAGIDKDTLEEYKKLISETGQLQLLEVGSEERHAAWKEGDPDWILIDGPKKGITDSTRGGQTLHYSKFKHADRNKVLVKKNPIITGGHITEARPGPDPDGGVACHFVLNGDGELRFSLTTGELVAQKPLGRIAIVLDKKMITMPTVQSQIGAQGLITGDYSDLAPANMPETERRQKGIETLSIILKAGELPYPIGSVDPDGTIRLHVPEQETWVGPSLGQDAIQKGLWSLAIASAAVILFMLVYYRGAGVVAVIALVLNVAMIGAVMSLFGATLSLAGLAGIVLTVGMAVDANILVYERIREELARGKTTLQAFEQGDDRAFVTILDSNITTFIIGIVLFYIAVGPVKGFAVTLMIGIITTLVSVLWFGKIILKGMITSQILTEFKMMRLFARPNIAWVRKMPAFGVLSVLAVGGAVAILMLNGGLTTADAAEADGRIVNAPQQGQAVVRLTGNLGTADVAIPNLAERDTVVQKINEAAARTGVVATPDGRVRSAEFGGNAFVQVEFVSDTLDGIKEGRRTGVTASPNLGIDFRGGAIVNFTLNVESEIEEVRRAILSVRDASGLSRYSDLSLQTVADAQAESALAEVGTFRTRSRNFQMRTAFGDKDRILTDLEEALKGKLPHRPFAAVPREQLPADQVFFIAAATPEGNKPGAGLRVYVDRTKVTDPAKVQEAIQKAAAVERVVSPTPFGPALKVVPDPEAPEGLLSFVVVLSAHDAVDPNNKQKTTDVLDQVRDAIKQSKDAIPLSRDPFPYASYIGPAAARDLRDSSLRALLVAAALQVVYIWLRFLRSWRFGVAAVIPLVHDALIALGTVALCRVIVPESWGLNFEINMPTVAAVLTIVGFSINDTIVVFDRIRENLILMKNATFADIIDASVNSTLSRTILTATTVLMSVLVLYVVTARIGSGIAEFSFPMIIGVIVGTYSTVGVASLLLKLMYRGGKPAVAAS
jgi:preprotein translocase subunit SecD